MSIAEFQRMKTLEFKVAALEEMVDKLVAHCFGVDAADDLEDFVADVSKPPRKSGRPRKDVADVQQ